MTMLNTPLWVPEEQILSSSPMARFLRACEARTDSRFPDYDALHKWSIDDPGAFWSTVWDVCGVVGDRGDVVLENQATMIDARFFPNGSLNFAENLLRRSGPGPAIIFRGEDKRRYTWSWDELRERVSKLQQILTAMGVGEGDRVAAMMPNIPETVAIMLATASLGAVWASCSPDFGVSGVLDRMGQISPKLFVACDSYWYAGKRHDIGVKVRDIAAALMVPTLLVTYAGGAAEIAQGIPQASDLDSLMAQFKARELTFRWFGFATPLYILFSSGTTGVPKCIVHSAGGTLLQHLKEQRLHCGVEAGEKVFYYTTCGWMMWNWLVSALACEATLCLYDGAPSHPTADVLFDFAEEEGISVFGTSAKFIDSLRKGGEKPGETRKLESLRLLASTGSPLSPEGFTYVYQAIKSDLQLASIAGGTDIVSCFVLGIPIKPVWKGEIQGAGLGLAVDVWNERGAPVNNVKGELVCTKPFPSMPIGFWNDPGRKRYRAAYFERFDNVWCHGDFAERTGHGGFIIHGRSDAVLNPGGVRIGTAEIYNQVEGMAEVIEAICVGQEWDDDVRVVLFVRLASGIALDEPLQKRIRDRIRINASPRHVPAKIIEVADIPRTKSGKIVEIAVRDIIHGKPVNNIEALANPGALDLYLSLEALNQ